MTKRSRSKTQSSLGGLVLLGLVAGVVYLVATHQINITVPPVISTAVSGVINSITTPSNNATAAPRDPSNSAHLPDPQLTPGDTLDVTSSDICVSGYSAKVRDVPQSVKDQAYAEYGITSHAPGSYEVDHLISLELGGSNSIKNLWPEPYTGDWNAHVKDKLENKLHDLICSGQLDLKSAQQQIATDWMSAYVKYIGQP
jgi:hypothetical protein